MPEFLTIVFFVYIFIAFYFFFLFSLIYISNRKRFFSYPEISREYSLNMVIPCYNEQENIVESVKSLLNSDYRGLKKIIVVDDCSTDNSYEIIKKFAGKYPKVIVVRTPKNTGRASGAKNYGTKFSDSELIGFTDADSFPQKESIRKMIGFFDDEKIAAVTPMILVKGRNKFIEKLQSIEYKIISFTRRLLGFVDAVYVTPGPLAIYKRKYFDEVGGFDEGNLTEDIEITWHLISEGYNVGMCNLARVYTIAPNNLKEWFNQRIRWNLGGIQTISKYKKSFLKRGMLGNFVLPLFVSSWILAVFGIFVLAYRIFRRIFFYYLSTRFSVESQVAILTLREINLTPNVLIFFGWLIFILGISFTIIALSYSKEKEFKKHSLFDLLTYTFGYLLLYPIVLIVSGYKFLKRQVKW